MNIRLGVYDIFSRIIPGSLYIIAIGQFLAILGLVKIDLQTLKSFSIIEYTAFAVGGYVVGGAFDRFTLRWFWLFAKKGFSTRSFVAFKEHHKDHWEINFGDDDWQTLFAFVRTKNYELSSELDRYNALSIMLRNISFAVLLLMINQFVQFFILRHSASLAVGVVLLVLAILVIQESVKFRGWFYGYLYETVLAYRIDLEDAIKPIKISERQRKSKKGE